MLTRRERLMRTVRGEPVDRPAVSFYEIGGWRGNPDDPDPFNVFNDPSWRPLLDLAEAETDLIRMVSAGASPIPGIDRSRFFKWDEWTEGGRRFARQTVTAAGPKSGPVPGRTLTSLRRRDPELNTWWEIEHLLKGVEDLEAYLELPDEYFAQEPDIAPLLAAEQEVGDRGIVMVDCGDPIAHSALLFPMAEFTIIALTEPKLFHRLLEKHARHVHVATEKVAKAFPGHLWRICGPELATEPYLPPRLFEEYVVRYTRPMVEAINRHGGVARIHCHGRIRSALPHFVAMGAGGTDPIEPPPQGDVDLGWVRREFGRELILFGNIEIAELEYMEPPAFERRVAQALRDGTSGPGRGFVLHPSACPCGRTITPRTMKNYETMVRLAKAFGG